MVRMAAWLEPHLESGSVAPIPAPLLEMLLIGPVAETARRWLSGDPSLDLDEPARVLPGRIWHSLAAGGAA